MDFALGIRKPAFGRLGFQYFYGFMGGETDQWTPYLFRDHTQISPWIAEQLKFYDTWGAAETYPHMAVAWSWAFDTPFKWTKQVPFRFNGKIDKLTFKLGPVQLADGDKNTASRAVAKAKD